MYKVAHNALLIVLMFVTSCNNEKESARFYVPDSFEGSVFLILDKDSGQDPKIVDGIATYEFDSKGALRVKGYEPIKNVWIKAFTYSGKSLYLTKLFWGVPAEGCLHVTEFEITHDKSTDLDMILDVEEELKKRGVSIRVKK
ncbi:MAG: hypothetical protein AB7F75_04590 [Planctomycetota bacterium]